MKVHRPCGQHSDGYFINVKDKFSFGVCCSFELVSMLEKPAPAASTVEELVCLQCWRHASLSLQLIIVIIAVGWLQSTTSSNTSHRHARLFKSLLANDITSWALVPTCFLASCASPPNPLLGEKVKKQREQWELHSYTICCRLPATVGV